MGRMRFATRRRCSRAAGDTYCIGLKEKERCRNLRLQSVYTIVGTIWVIAFMDKMIAGAEMEAYIAGILAALFFILSEISELKYEL